MILENTYKRFKFDNYGVASACSLAVDESSKKNGGSKMKSEKSKVKGEKSKVKSERLVCYLLIVFYCLLTKFVGILVLCFVSFLSFVVGIVRNNRSIKKFAAILMLSLFVTAACTYRHLHRPFTEFSEAADLIGKNTVYVFEQLQKEEIALRIAESIGKDSLEPADLLPRVLTAAHLETRKEFIGYIVSYTRLLESLITKDHNSSILSSAQKVQENLRRIGSNHDDFLAKNERGIMTAAAAIIPAALTSARHRKVVLTVMKQHGPMIEKASALLKEELEAVKLMINNFYSRLFRLKAAAPWPGEEAKRERYAGIGAEILERKTKINIILSDLIEALAILPPTHARLLQLVRTNKGPLRTLASFVDYAVRVAELARDFSDEQETKEEE